MFSAALLLLGCSSSASPEPQTETVALRGLSLQVPSGSVDSLSGEQLVLREDAEIRRQGGLGMRAPWQISLTLRPEAPPLPCSEPSGLRIRAGRWATSCGRVELGGGSGGMVYEHRGWMRLSDGTHLYFVLDDQAEWPAAPREDLLMLVLRSVP